MNTWYSNKRIAGFLRRNAQPLMEGQTVSFGGYNYRVNCGWVGHPEPYVIYRMSVDSAILGSDTWYRVAYIGDSNEIIMIDIDAD